MITGKGRLVERNVTAAQIVGRAAPGTWRSSCCGAALLGSAAMWCAACGRTIPAADLDHDYHPPTTEAGAQLTITTDNAKGAA